MSLPLKGQSNSNKENRNLMLLSRKKEKKTYMKPFFFEKSEPSTPSLIQGSRDQVTLSPFAGVSIKKMAASSLRFFFPSCCGQAVIRLGFLGFLKLEFLKEPWKKKRKKGDNGL